METVTQPQTLIASPRRIEYSPMGGFFSVDGVRRHFCLPICLTGMTTGVTESGPYAELAFPDFDGQPMTMHLTGDGYDQFMRVVEELAIKGLPVNGSIIAAFPDNKSNPDFTRPLRFTLDGAAHVRASLQAQTLLIEEFSFRDQITSNRFSTDYIIVASRWEGFVREVNNFFEQYHPAGYGSSVDAPRFRNGLWLAKAHTSNSCD